jgi:hypothetical protein
MMRALFLALLLVNLVLFAWYRWYVVTPGLPASAAAPGGKPLQLMSELTPAEKKALAAASAVAENPAPATSAAPAVAAPGLATASLATSAQACATYGPFPSEDALHSAEAILKPAGLQVNEHTVAGRAQLGYWVYLPPFGSKSEADAAAALLKRRGVGDLYVVTDEANRNAISLGVFNQQSGAVERQKAMKKLGFKALMAERFRDEPRYWLDVRGTGAMPGAEAFKELGEDGTPIGRATGICPTQN